MKPQALDLFCGAGGVSAGLVLAGFDVVGIDIEPQPRYPFRFAQADALDARLDGYDFVWASPPCQRYCMYSKNIGTADNHPDLVAATREKLTRWGGVWAIENVEGAPLRSPTMLCGTMFGMKLLRHRLFETSWTISELLPPCNHRGDEIPVYGNGTPQWHRERVGRGITVAEKRAAMGIDWMNRDELSQAIPPTYSMWIGGHAKREIERNAA